MFLAGLYVKVRTNNELFVDTSRGEIMQIHVRQFALYMIASHSVLENINLLLGTQK